MRVTSSMTVRSTLRDLGLGYQRLAHTQQQLSTGRAILRPSDDPTGAADAMNYRQLLRRNEQYVRATNDAQGWLQTADSKLVSGLDQLVKAKELVARGMNSGSIGDPVARGAIALEISSIRDEMLSLANSQFGDRPLFSGTADGDAYAPDGTYLGNVGAGSAILRDVAPSTSFAVNVTGPDVFGDETDPVGNLFQVLGRIEQAMIAGDTAALDTEHAHLDAAMARMSSATVEIGSRAARIDGIRARAEDDQLGLRTLLSEVEDVDVVEALINVQARENAYQAALSAASKIVPMSLLDYLR